VIYAIFALSLIGTLLIVFERRVYRIIIYFGVFSLIISVAYLLLGAPDVAMAEAVTSAFSTIFFIVCIEKYYHRKGVIKTDSEEKEKLKFAGMLKILSALVFCAVLFFLYLRFMPNAEITTYLKDNYLLRFMSEVGGENAITAIYLGYRVYDTLFEALILVISVVAVTHLSFFEKGTVADGKRSEIKNSSMTAFTLRIVCPVILIFGIYLIANGHISAGGGFQGGLAVATFFICRYMIYDIYDMPVKKIIRLEEIVFICIMIIAIFTVLLGFSEYITAEHGNTYQVLYLIMMNVLVGLKVACGFFVLFYRYIAIERR
jgi:multicomponent Na+:H+ antiporter subunit B